MPRFVLDANIPITFDLPQLNYLDGLLSALTQTGQEVLMCRTNFLEISTRALRSKLERCGAFRVVELDSRTYQRVRTEVDNAWGRHGPGIQRPDYECIATAVQTDAEFLVSNDRKLLEALERFRAAQAIAKTKLLPTHSAAMLRFLHGLRRDVYDTKRHILMNVDYYHYVEIPLTHGGIRERAWTIGDAVESFSPYALNIQESLGEFVP